MNNIEIFNKHLLRLKEARSDRNDFLVREAEQIIAEKLACIKRNFHSVRQLTRYDETLTAEADTYDLIKSSLALHWVNDVLGLLAKIIFALKADGLFIASFFGGESLKELKIAFSEADKNSLSPRVSPFITAEAAAQLLQAAGFALPVVDVEKITVSYEDAFALMRHLRKIGETNSLFKQRKNFASRGFMNKVNDFYSKNFPDPETKDKKRIIASFEIITMTGWKPHASQQKPQRRGSAKKKLADAL